MSRPIDVASLTIHSPLLDGVVALQKRSMNTKADGILLIQKLPADRDVYDEIKLTIRTEYHNCRDCRSYKEVMFWRFRGRRNETVIVSELLSH